VTAAPSTNTLPRSTHRLTRDHGAPVRALTNAVTVAPSAPAIQGPAGVSTMGPEVTRAAGARGPTSGGGAGPVGPDHGGAARRVADLPLARRLLRAADTKEEMKMKPVKFLLVALGALCAVAVFLPFASIGGGDLGGGDEVSLSVSLWTLKAVKPAPTYIALLGSLGLIAIGAIGIAKQRFGRGMAAGALALGAIVAAITILQFSPEAPFGKFSGVGAKILLAGGALAAVASIVGLVKPERGLAA
jgi:hypothetical protein